MIWFNTPVQGREMEDEVRLVGDLTRIQRVRLERYFKRRRVSATTIAHFLAAHLAGESPALPLPNLSPRKLIDDVHDLGLSVVFRGKTLHPNPYLARLTAPETCGRFRPERIDRVSGRNFLPGEVIHGTVESGCLLGGRLHTDHWLVTEIRNVFPHQIEIDSSQQAFEHWSRFLRRDDPITELLVSGQKIRWKNPDCNAHRL